MGILSLIGHSAGWEYANLPVWHAWLEILVGIISLIIAAADTKE
jgi:membrane-associated protease RseP (regulator of RpoE activity)